VDWVACRTTLEIWGGKGEMGVKDHPKESKAFDPSYPRQGSGNNRALLAWRQETISCADLLL